VTRPENRDELTLRVVLSDESADRSAISETLSRSVQSSCRVKVDQVEFVGNADIEDGTGIVVDKRKWG
jgi:hypothetical protein